MEPDSELVDFVAQTLENMLISPQYQDEEHGLQPDVKSTLDTALKDRYGALFRSVISIGPDTPKPSVEMFGTSFWPDMEILRGDKPVLGIEIKIIRKGQSAARQLSEALGQALIYTIRYPNVIVFALHSGIYNPKLLREDPKMSRLLQKLNIRFVLRRHDTAG
ncbi:MAG: hypothetical protein ACREKR_02690 [Candidatus Methylomirabilales bacterium]